jgi:signal transduction histidine kinase/ActR/RegA family two-component response regulator
MSEKTRDLALRYGTAVAATAVAAGARMFLAPWLEGRAPLVTFFGSVMIAAWYGGLGPALFALGLGLAAATVFFLPPADFGTDETVLLALYAVVGVVISVLSGSLRTARQRTSKQNETLLSTQERLREHMAELTEARERFKFLANASAALAALVDYESTLGSVSRMAVPLFADWCAVDLTGPDGTCRRLHANPVGPENSRPLTEILERYFPLQPDAPHGPGRVLQTGHAELVELVTDPTPVECSANPEPLGTIQTLRPQSSMSVPLEVQGKLLGVMTFVRVQHGHHYGPADLAIAEDLAHRAAVAIENARLYSEIKETDHRKDEFLAMLAHELRNPLAPIRTGLDLLDMDATDAETAAWTRGMMKQQIQHLVRLVDDLLDVSRFTRGSIQLRKEPVRLRDAINRAVELSRSLVEAQGHRLLLSLPEEPVYVDADPVRLAQIVANLLNNAAKYQDKPGHIWATAQREGNHAVIRVRDDGIGIDRSLLPQVFDAFTQSDRSIAHSRGGLGLGLTLVRRLVEMHGGTVSSYSEGLGKGSEFTVHLPALERRPESIRPVQAGPKQEGVRATAHHRVLVVDDNVEAARTLAEITGLWDNDVRVAHTGPAALEVAREYHPDVVLLDIGLPGMSGYEVAGRLRQLPECARATLVAITGYGQEEDRQRSFAAGFDEHLVKPVAPEALQQVLTGAAHAGTPRPPRTLTPISAM